MTNHRVSIRSQWEINAAEARRQWAIPPAPAGSRFFLCECFVDGQRQTVCISFDPGELSPESTSAEIQAVMQTLLEAEGVDDLPCLGSYH